MYCSSEVSLEKYIQKKSCFFEIEDISKFALYSCKDVCRALHSIGEILLILVMNVVFEYYFTTNGKSSSSPDLLNRDQKLRVAVTAGGRPSRGRKRRDHCCNKWLQRQRDVSDRRRPAGWFRWGCVGQDYCIHLSIDWCRCQKLYCNYGIFPTTLIYKEIMMCGSSGL